MTQNFLLIRTSTQYALHNNRVTKFCWAVSEELCLTNCFSSLFHFCKISKFERGFTPSKNNELEFPANLHIYTSCLSSLQNFTKICRAVSEEFHWHKTGLKNGLIDWRLRTDGSKTLYPPQLVAWGITISRLNTSTCIRYILVAFPMVRFTCFLTSILEIPMSIVSNCDEYLLSGTGVWNPNRTMSLYSLLSSNC